MMDKDKYIDLAGKVADGTASDQEIAQYNSYYNAYQHKYPSWTQLDEQQRKEMLTETQEEIHKQLHEHAENRQTKLWPRIIGVAAAVAAITLGVWLYNISNTTRHPELVSGPPLANDIAPGKNTATIKIGDGEAITLSDKQTGVIVGDDLRYSDGSKISGRHPELVSGSPHSLMTVTTPRGGTYQVTLPDGTKVWLNAASVLTYTMPLKERGGIRKVQLSGEAYFEVFRNKNQPFVVTTKKLTTTVLGTHFNISAYEDEHTARATLLEGSVKVNDVILKPNQQASVRGSTGIKVKEVDVSETVAWKEGKFRFNDASLEEVMRQLSRWYDVEVSYPEGVPEMNFTGDMNRNVNLSETLALLNYTKLKFKIEGKKIIVTR